MLQRLRPRRTGWLWPVLLVVLPWTWWLWRDRTGPVGDVVAILLPVVVLLVVLGEAYMRRPALIPAMISVLAMGTVAVLEPWSAHDAGPVAPAGAVRIASANITGDAGDPAALLANPADVTVISENSRAIDERLAAAYPYHVYGAGTTDGVGVYSRYPLQIRQGAGPDLPGVKVQVAAPVPFTLFALHVPRPWISDQGYEVSPMEHHRIMVALAAAAAATNGPVVLTGDLNTSDRGRDYRVMAAGLTDAMRADRTRPTSVTTWRLFLLKIDHLFVSPGWCGDDPAYPPLPGSDHDAIAATVGPCG
jgi:endonuclease/exonuclease/phosphatase (EEP) superfamily protein YafD